MMLHNTSLGCVFSLFLSPGISLEALWRQGNAKRSGPDLPPAPPPTPSTSPHTCISRWPVYPVGQTPAARQSPQPPHTPLNRPRLIPDSKFWNINPFGCLTNTQGVKVPKPRPGQWNPHRPPWNRSFLSNRVFPKSKMTPQIGHARRTVYFYSWVIVGG